MSAVNLYLNGHSQAVCLPRAFRFKGLTEVCTERDCDRAILGPTCRPSIERLIDALGIFEAVPDRQQPAQADGRGAL